MNLILDVSDFNPIEFQFKRDLPALSSHLDIKELLLDSAFWLAYEELKSPETEGKTELYTVSHEIVEQVLTENQYEIDPHGYIADSCLAESMSLEYALVVEKIYDYAFMLSSMHLARLVRKNELDKIKFQKNLMLVRLLQNEQTNSY